MTVISDATDTLLANLMHSLKSLDITNPGLNNIEIPKNILRSVLTGYIELREGRDMTEAQKIDMVKEMTFELTCHQIADMLHDFAEQEGCEHTLVASRMVREMFPTKVEKASLN